MLDDTRAAAGAAPAARTEQRHNAQQRQEQRQRLDAISHPTLLAAIFERLPLAEQCLIVSRLDHSWREWAAPKRGELEPQLAALQYPFHIPTPCPPLWLLLESWPHCSERARCKVPTRAARCGDVATFEAIEALPADLSSEGAGIRIFAAAAASGSVELLELLQRRLGLSVPEYPLGFDPHPVIISSVAAGRIEALQWLRQLEPPCPWDEYTCAFAAVFGQLDVLRWLRRQEPPCPWNHRTGVEAARKGQLEVLRWLRQQQLPWPWSPSNTWAAAVERRQFKVMSWLRDERVPWDESVCAAAAAHGHIDVLQWLRDQQPPCPWDDLSCLQAVAFGHIDVLRWLREQQPLCPWDRDSCRVQCMWHLIAADLPTTMMAELDTVP